MALPNTCDAVVLQAMMDGLKRDGVTEMSEVCAISNMATSKVKAVLKECKQDYEKAELVLRTALVALATQYQQKSRASVQR